MAKSHAQMAGYRWRCCAAKCVVALNWDVGGEGLWGLSRDAVALCGALWDERVSASHSIYWRYWMT